MFLSRFGRWSFLFMVIFWGGQSGKWDCGVLKEGWVVCGVVVGGDGVAEGFYLALGEDGEM